MTLDEVLGELEGVRRSGSGYVALCPAHDDRNASLSVDEKDGTLLLYCHAGCEYRDIAKALGIEGQPALEEDVVYTYLDEDRRPLFDVVRRPGKEFIQRRYLPDGGTEWGLAPETRRVLYRLPDVLEADPKRWVFVCEGEKDADAIWAAGGVATCNPHGAGHWRDEFSEVLAGRNVTVVRDRDEAGAKHASQVMISLGRKPQALRLVEARKGKDASDHLRAGYGLEDWIEPSFFQPLDFTKPAPEPKWVLEGRVAEGDLVLLSGAPGLGKSWWTMALAVAVVSGGMFLNRTVKHGRVLYFDEENPEDVIYDRLKRLGHEPTNKNLRYISNGGVRLDTHPELLIQEALVFSPDLIVLDSLARVHSKEENSFAEMSEILNGTLRKLARSTGAGVILIHHHDKSNRGPRGSGDIVAAVDCQIDLYGEPGSGEMYERVKKSRRAKSGGNTNIKIVSGLPGGGTVLRVV